MRLQLYTVNTEYCDFLRKYDERVPIVSGPKEGRLFVGILICVNRKNYFAPLTSPKKKHLNMKDSQDFIKIKNGELGAINLNNMIPIPSTELEKIDINNISDDKYRQLLKKQISWCNSYSDRIVIRAYSLYKNMKYNNLQDALKNRCCDFSLLEKACYDYMHSNGVEEESLLYVFA